MGNFSGVGERIGEHIGTSDQADRSGDGAREETSKENCKHKTWTGPQKGKTPLGRAVI